MMSAVIGVVGCAGDQDTDRTAAGPSSLGDDAPTLGDGDVSSDVFSEASTGPVDADVDSVVTYELVPETGVPGIDSDDVFCRSWSEYAGSFGALTYAWSAQLPVDAARLEVAASAALIGAVDTMAEVLPAEIESNRQDLTVDVPAPFLRRAERARELLVEAGLDDATIAALGAAWIAAITEAGLFADDLAIAIPDAAADELAAAADQFVAEFPQISEDPTLDTTEFDISPSLDYISVTCPDRGTLSGNDNIAQDAQDAQ